MNGTTFSMISEDTASVLRVRSRFAGDPNEEASWGAASVIPTGAGNHDPRVINGAGAPVLVRREGASLVARPVVGGADSVIDADAPGNFDAWGDSSGRKHVAWTRPDSGAIVWRTSTDGVTWGPRVTILAGETAITHLRGAAAPDGQGFVAYRTTSGNVRVIALEPFTAPPPPPPPLPPGPPPTPPATTCLAETTAGYRHPAKMRVSRLGVLREDRRLDALAPITSRARGVDVDVRFQADGRSDTFTAPVTAGGGALDEVRFREPITAGQARLGTGIVTLNYPGNASTRSEEVRLRAASQRARLDVEQISLLGDRLSARGSTTSRAEGIVRLRYSYLDAVGRPQVHLARATIADDGDWELANGAVPSQLARCGGYLSILFTGYFERRIRGEMLAYELNPGQTRRP